MSSSKKEAPSDEIAVGPEVSPGVYTGLRRSGEDGSVRRVLLRDRVEGAPILPGSELAHVGEQTNGPWQKLTTLYKAGPAQVATPKYREGYDRIFGKKQKVGEA